jgi:ATP-dependent phosphoenolpyruvate carboxykinase
MWEDKSSYERQASELAARFSANFRQFDTPEDIRTAGPQRISP